MNKYREWYYDGKWHSYPKNKEPFQIMTLPPPPDDFAVKVLVDGVEIPLIDWIRCQIIRTLNLTHVRAGSRNK